MAAGRWALVPLTMNRRIVMSASMLGVRGRLQKEGEVIHGLTTDEDRPVAIALIGQSAIDA
jgi:hypothetical protein